MANIRQVAKLAGVSASTVSRILNDDTSLSVTDQTRTKVLAATKKLNYNIKNKNKKWQEVGVLTNMDLYQVS